MTTMHHTYFRSTLRAKHDGPPRYVPPTLRDNNRTSRGSRLPNSGHSTGWRDPPPHKDPEVQSPKRSDSLNWRAPSPNHPISFQNSTTPPQSLPAPPIRPLYPSEML